MTTIKRTGVFETNSSSCHSLLINGHSGLLETIEPVYGIVEISAGEYGWEFCDYDTPAEKASYVYTLYVAANHEVESLREVIKSHTGADEVRFVGEGYVDHKSVGDMVDEIRGKERDVIFDPSYVIRTDNDNH